MRPIDYRDQVRGLVEEALGARTNWDHVPEPILTLILAQGLSVAEAARQCLRRILAGEAVARPE